MSIERREWMELVADLQAKLAAAEARVAELTAWPSAQALIDKLAKAEALLREATSVPAMRSIDWVDWYERAKEVCGE